MAQYRFVDKGPRIIWVPFWLLVSSRPRQWLKNLAIYATLVFEGEFFNIDKFLLTTLGFAIFCVVTSGIYIINDIIDLEKDKHHPFKSKRPIAAGRINPILALVFALVLLAVAFIASYQISTFFTFAAVSYAILQIIYSLFLRSIILLDVMAIASGFLLRIYAGAVLIDAHVTIWFILTVASLALFLAIGKRRSERTLLSGPKTKSIQTRSILVHYPESLLDSLTVMFATATWFAYTMFTFLQPPPTAGPQVLVLFGDFLPRTFLASKWLMLTVPFVIYGVMRYLYVIHEKKEGESPERVLLSDIPLLVSVLVWTILVFFVIYGSDFLPARFVRLLQ
ncbi:MAG: Phosphoribose diphosphate:decaprenyl-phosphate phosphoribosyltransferase [Candidatus Curtissbacteria bacterium GW2011_GWA1_40_47]|nr:MAG: Phosphoribose diphosphate:decaprenyl-phosphate phosphoribosyltransferase [Candidatus Curtissbacteria bacterium GW2011_GWB1_40_28]KKR59677.1 MAG: Phosphoribose diphosphate:decaprenyl-phosphate phosphoribosyltransferase [Candidatus Curtissbacteria bacterium GW2011_GWA2_40_31]KKR60573.1 MAG: Phosphoribose diphosphate:decaprenyl-phosphate phosphoribosyltransferase [Microgenomates group bacterium GW2011_GWC1_40_35]KKR64741.1 MAG: Phosphoribose diphosphate:decaprenyl-phosphate phosphoribosyltr